MLRYNSRLSDRDIAERFITDPAPDVVGADFNHHLNEGWFALRF